jgi:hypothetical protein
MGSNLASRWSDRVIETCCWRRIALQSLWCSRRGSPADLWSLHIISLVIASFGQIGRESKISHSWVCVKLSRVSFFLSRSGLCWSSSALVCKDNDDLLVWTKLSPFGGEKASRGGNSQATNNTSTLILGLVCGPVSGASSHATAGLPGTSHQQEQALFRYINSPSNSNR